MLSAIASAQRKTAISSEKIEVRRNQGDSVRRL